MSLRSTESPPPPPSRSVSPSMHTTSVSASFATVGGIMSTVGRPLTQSTTLTYTVPLPSTGSAGRMPPPRYAMLASTEEEQHPLYHESARERESVTVARSRLGLLPVAESVSMPPPPPPDDDNYGSLENRDSMVMRNPQSSTPKHFNTQFDHAQVNCRSGNTHEHASDMGHPGGLQRNIGKYDLRPQVTPGAMGLRESGRYTKAHANLSTATVAPSRDELLAHLATLTARRKTDTLEKRGPDRVVGSPSRRKRSLSAGSHHSESVAAPQWAAINRTEQNTNRLRKQFEDLNREIRSLKLASPSKQPESMIKSNTSRTDPSTESYRNAENRRALALKMTKMKSGGPRAHSREQSSRVKKVDPIKQLDAAVGLDGGLMRTPWEITAEGARLASTVSVVLTILT